MSRVFVSYSRRDEDRAMRVVEALTNDGLEVDWDKELAGGVDWRQHLETQIDQAACVLVLWTEASTASNWVLEEASRARARGVLLPVRLDPVDPPFGFGTIHALDLLGWRGSRRNAYYRDVVAAIRAKLAGEAAPPPRAPQARLLWRLTVGSLSSAVGVAGLVFASNALNATSTLCAAPVAQPALSDLCGTLGVGGRATREERLAWEALPQGDCAALRAHIDQFPTGAYRAAAADHLAAATVDAVEHWRPAEQRLRLFVSANTMDSAPDEPGARQAALARGRTEAETLCAGFTATQLYRTAGEARPEPEAWRCGPRSGGIACGFEGFAVCMLEERVVTEQQRCGAVP